MVAQKFAVTLQEVCVVSNARNLHEAYDVSYMYTVNMARILSKLILVRISLKSTEELVK